MSVFCACGIVKGAPNADSIPDLIHFNFQPAAGCVFLRVSVSGKPYFVMQMHGRLAEIEDPFFLAELGGMRGF